MSKTSHTPGPWTVVENSWSDTSINANGKSIAGMTIYYTADEDNQEILMQEMAANAKLIACAPDLLDYLKQSLDIIKQQRVCPNFQAEARRFLEKFYE